MAKTYSEKLRDKRWQKRRLEILENAGWECENCGDGESLHVHHGYYAHGRDPWDYEDESLHALCDECHKDVEALLHSIRQVMGWMDFSDLLQVRGYVHMLYAKRKKYRVHTTSFESSLGVAQCLNNPGVSFVDAVTSVARRHDGWVTEKAVRDEVGRTK